MRLTLPAAGAVSTVLVVDDDPALVRALTINLRARGYEVHAAAHRSGRAAARRRPTHRTPSSSTWGCPTSTATR